MIKNTLLISVFILLSGCLLNLFGQKAGPFDVENAPPTFSNLVDVVPEGIVSPCGVNDPACWFVGTALNIDFDYDQDTNTLDFTSNRRIKEVWLPQINDSSTYDSYATCVGLFCDNVTIQNVPAYPPIPGIQKTKILVVFRLQGHSHFFGTYVTLN